MKAMCIDENRNFVWQDVPDPACHDEFDVKIRIRAFVHKVMPISEVAAAHAILERGENRGNVIMKVFMKLSFQAFLLGSIVIVGAGSPVVYGAGDRLSNPADGSSSRVRGLCADDMPDRNVFEIELCRVDDFTNRVTVAALDAGDVRMRDQDGKAVTECDGFTAAVHRVVWSRWTDNVDNRWKIAVTPAPGWAVVRTMFPRLALPAILGESGTDDVYLPATGHRNAVKNPSARVTGWSNDMFYPQNMVAQFSCFYDPQGGRYYACEDREGYPKAIEFVRTSDGFLLTFSRFGFDVGESCQPYDIVTRAFRNENGEMTDWRDAAEIYRAWALRQPWCGTPRMERLDQPEWMRTGTPGFVRFGSEWLGKPDLIRAWVRDYWRRRFPDIPLVVALWGWEHHGKWVTDEYFPFFPSDADFRALVADLRKMDAHVFLWPSGYNRTVTYLRQVNGSFRHDVRAALDEALGEALAVDVDGCRQRERKFWLGGGESAAMCSAHVKTKAWMNESLARVLGRAGAELLQMDQVVGGMTPICWSRNHGHQPGNGLWRVRSFLEQLTSWREILRQEHPNGGIVGVEEPCEQAVGLVGIQDYRDCQENGVENTSVFSYLYHEFVPPFQSNPHVFSLPVRMSAHCAVDGQIPHFTPSEADFRHNVPAIANGDFEERVAGEDVFAFWFRRLWWNEPFNGRIAADEREKTKGRMSLRMETDEGENLWIQQNLDTDDASFEDWTTYRISAQMKTAYGSTSNVVSLTLLPMDDRWIVGHESSVPPTCQLPSPLPGCWSRQSAEFVLREGRGKMRIDLNLSGKTKVWLDDLMIERKRTDGTFEPLFLTGRTVNQRLVESWMDLYHGKGRDYLAFGRQVRPPKLDCRMVPWEGACSPVVFVGAFRASSGREALVLSNWTTTDETVEFVWHGKGFKKCVPAASVVMLE